jgi:hypothetical protein
MKAGDLVEYVHDEWYYTLDDVIGSRVGLVIKADHINDRLKTRKVLFGGWFETNVKMYKLELVSESQ